PVESLMPLRLARYGVPLAETAPAGLAAAGIEPARLLRPQAPQPDPQVVEPAVGELAQTPPPGHWFATSRQTQHPGNAGDYVVDVEPPTAVLEHEDQSRNEEHQTTVPDASGGEPDEEWASFYRSAAERFAADQGYAPDADELSAYLLEQYDVADQYGRPLAPEYLAPYVMAANREAEVAREAAAGEQAPVNASRAADAGRVAVQMLIPERKSQQALAAEPAGEAPDAGTGALAEPEPGGAAPAEAKPSGIDLVEFHYRQLPPESQAKSAKALAPELAALSGYAVGTVRKYIGELRRRGSGEGTD
ncbi:hypothetical protein ACFVFJ_48070, partial [Streptomyces sp. NPDC057717]